MYAKIKHSLEAYKIYSLDDSSTFMFYSFELFLAGIILFSAMFAGGISLWIKRRREQEKNISENDGKINPE